MIGMRPPTLTTVGESAHTTPYHHFEGAGALPKVRYEFINPIAHYIFICKLVNISSGVQKHLSAISGSWDIDIGNTIWGIRFQEFEIINNLISWNLILQQLLHYFSNYEYFKRLDIFHFKGDLVWHVSGSNPFLYNIREPKYKQTIQDIRF